jgi:hypothetical protein
MSSESEAEVFEAAILAHYLDQQFKKKRKCRQKRIFEKHRELAQKRTSIFRLIKKTTDMSFLHKKLDQFSLNI